MRGMFWYFAPAWWRREKRTQLTPHISLFPLSLPRERTGAESLACLSIAVVVNGQKQVDVTDNNNNNNNR
jgi:hypothetical protein